MGGGFPANKKLSYYDPGPEERNAVRRFAMAGYTQKQIAETLGVSEESVYKHFKKEIADGVRVANSNVVGWLYENCQKGNVLAQIFWCKTRLGWREADRLEITGPNGSNLFQGIIDVTPISGEDWIKEYGRDSIESNAGSANGAIEQTSEGHLETSGRTTEGSS